MEELKSTEVLLYSSDLHTSPEDKLLLIILLLLNISRQLAHKHYTPRFVFRFSTNHLLTYLLTYLLTHSLTHSLTYLKERKLHLYSASLWEARLWSALRHGSHSFFTLQLHHTCLYLVKHSPDGAATDSDNSCLIAAYYSFIDPERMKGWVGLVGWPTAYGLPI